MPPGGFTPSLSTGGQSATDQYFTQGGTTFGNVNFSARPTPWLLYGVLVLGGLYLWKRR